MNILNINKSRTKWTKNFQWRNKSAKIHSYIGFIYLHSTMAAVFIDEKDILSGFLGISPCTVFSDLKEFIYTAFQQSHSYYSLNWIVNRTKWNPKNCFCYVVIFCFRPEWKPLTRNSKLFCQPTSLRNCEDQNVIIKCVKLHYQLWRATWKEYIFFAPTGEYLPD